MILWRKKGTFRLFLIRKRKSFMRLIFVFLFLSLCSSIVLAQEIKQLELNPNDLPESIVYDGVIIHGTKWIDSEGENIMILTETEVSQDTDDPFGAFGSAELYAFHFLKNGSNYDLIWKAHDKGDQCEEGLYQEHLAKSLAITDLDNDGIGEASFVYRSYCMSFVTPMRLIIHEGPSEYSITGEASLDISGETPGRVEEKFLDPSFNEAPNSFLSFSKNLWSQYSKETPWLEIHKDNSNMEDGQFVVRDANNEMIELPEEVQSGLSKSSTPSLLNDNRYLVYNEENVYKLYDFETTELKDLLEVNEKTSCSTAFTESRTGFKVAFVSRKENAESNADLLVLTVSNGKVVRKDNHQISLNVDCSNQNSWKNAPGNEFWFVNDHTLKYKYVPGSEKAGEELIQTIMLD